MTEDKRIRKQTSESLVDIYIPLYPISFFHSFCMRDGVLKVKEVVRTLRMSHGP